MVKIRDIIINPRGLPSSGTLSMSQIKGEFSKGNTFSSYYGAASGIPASGRMSVSDFYGKASGPPPGQPSVIWDGTGTPPSWLMPSLRITQNAHTAPASPDNIASTSTRMDAPMKGNLVVSAKDTGAQTRILNPKMEMKFAVKNWQVSQSALGCKIKITFQINSKSPNWTDGTPRHKLYGQPAAGASKVVCHEKAGASWAGSPTFTTTQTIYDYIQNGQSLVMDAQWNLADGSNYNRYTGGGYAGITVKKIEAVV